MARRRQETVVPVAMRGGRAAAAQEYRVRIVTREDGSTVPEEGFHVRGASEEDAEIDFDAGNSFGSLD
ncbi:MAG: hypothetical protein LQ351_004351 [Letrouitia transgressa]|nr:MAG: hypothetical protein LQ351_004351 [Letrouitia transgressa]